MAENAPPSNPLKILWLVLVAILTLASGFLGIFKDYRWAIHFLPDLIALCALVSMAYYAYHHWLNGLMPYFGYVLRLRSSRKRVCIASILVLFFIASLFVTKNLIDYYRLRLFSAKFDWHYALAKEYLNKGLYKEADKEFDKQGVVFTYYSEGMVLRAQKESQDIKKRLREVEIYLERFKEATTSDKNASFVELLLVQRAFSLYPKSQEVIAAKDKVEKLLERALRTYFSGVKQLKVGNFEQAKQQLLLSRQYCANLLHQNILLQYCSPTQRVLLDNEESMVVKFYLNTPLQEIQQTIMKGPLLSWLSTN